MKYAKHVHVLELLNSIPRQDFNPSLPSWAKQRIGIATREQANAVFDHLFAYIHVNWAAPSTATGDHWTQLSGDARAELVDCKDMLQMGPAEIEAKLETLPPYFTEAVFPVAVARFLLRELALPINHRELTTFKEFHNRYGFMILEC